MNAATVIRWPMRGRYTHGYPARRAGSTPCRWRLPSRTPGALLSDWRAAKAVAARVPGPASCARNARLAVCGPACAHASPMSAVNTVILRYGRAVAPCQRRRRGRTRRLAHGAAMPGEPGGNRQPVRRGPKPRPAEATMRSGQRSCRRGVLQQTGPACQARPSRSSAATAPRNPGPRSAGRSILLPVAHSSSARRCC